jgi:preprotein translocase subunit SecE
MADDERDDDTTAEDEEAEETREEESKPARASTAEKSTNPTAMRALGLERWVLLGYLVIFAAGIWLFEKIVALAWDELSLYVEAVPEPTDIPVLAAAVLLSILLVVVLWRHKKARTFADESAAELSKVTWPSRKETYANTVVVIVTSVIAAIILFAFDAAWSWITDLIYV